MSKKGEDPRIKEVKLSYGVAETQIKYIQGKVLTVVDASYTDAIQRKAIKDLINHSFAESLNWLYDLSHPEVQSLSEAQMVQVDVEETLKS